MDLSPNCYIAEIISNDQQIIGGRAFTRCLRRYLLAQALLRRA
jgi:hypothetical protein